MTDHLPAKDETTSCPTAERLQAVIDGVLPEEEQAQLAEHLNACTACQKLVEQLAGGPEIIPTTAPVIVEDTSDALSQVMQRLRRAESSAPVDDDELLRFLVASPEPDFIGRFGAYNILELIGRGGMGLVLRAYDRSLNRIVAIKVLLPQLATKRDARQRFLREAQAAAAVIHENVVTIHAVDEHDDLPYLVMEYIEGQSLQKRIEAGTLDLEEILRIGAQISAGLAAAHEQGLVHRDIKPANILLQNGVARVKITDFGLAKAVDDVSLTRTGTISGTPQYLSPEQADSHHVDHRTDLFSLGGVLYAMCTGRPPFVGDSTARIIRQVCDAQPRPISKINEDTPAWLIGIIRRLLEKDPRRRYATAAEVEQLLKQRLSEVQSGEVVSTWTTHIVSNVVKVAAAVVILAAVGFAGPSLFRSLTSNDRESEPGQQETVPTAVAASAQDFRIAGAATTFPSLVDAIKGAESGDTIEIAGNGPYEVYPFTLDKPLTIRAASGYQPQLHIVQGRSGIATTSDLRLEGIHILSEKDPSFLVHNPIQMGIVKSRSSKLEVIDCVLEGNEIGGITFEGEYCRIENSLLQSPMAFNLVWHLIPGGKLQIHNSVLSARGLMSLVRSVPLNAENLAELEVTQSTLVGNTAIRYDAKVVQTNEEGEAVLADAPTLRARIANSLVDTECFVNFSPPPGRFAVRPGVRMRVLMNLFDWQEDGNFYRQGMEMAIMQSMRQRVPFLPGDNDLAAWQTLFGVQDPESHEGTVEYENSDPGNRFLRVRTLHPSPEGQMIGATLNRLPPKQ